MIKFKFKLNKYFIIGGYTVLVLSGAALIWSVVNLFGASKAGDYFTAGFLILLNLFISLTVSLYLFLSDYRFFEKDLVVRTAYFKDKIPYRTIVKLHHYATEDKLYLELREGKQKFLEINLERDKTGDFTNELRQKLPDLQYEVSLKIDNDPEL
jgi:hypothetical protein